jgi:protein TonB
MLPANPPPFARVSALASRERRRFYRASLLALGLHVAVAWAGTWASNELASFARGVQSSLEHDKHREILVALEREPPPPPEPPAPVPETPAPKAPEPKPVKVDKAPARPVEAPPAPAPAQAGRVLAAEPDPEEPLDLTGNTFVQGNADAYVGGVTAANGRATQPVRNLHAQGDGVPGGTGTAPSGADHSRRATPLEKNWDCPFPAEAGGIDSLLVNVAVTVSPSGKVTKVDVLGDPGHGFGREAVRCAFAQSFSSALDQSGKPVATTIAIVVRFKRR